MVFSSLLFSSLLFSTQLFFFPPHSRVLVNGIEWRLLQNTPLPYLHTDIGLGTIVRL